MGSNLIGADQTGALIAGSFSGGFRLDPATGQVTDIFTGAEAVDVSPCGWRITWSAEYS